ncbi:MAG TPA: hypothetical protein VL949_10330 [Geobacteraceae bacterium]|nr:hypothetical protein [Geobacteraceae bacterium]
MRILISIDDTDNLESRGTGDLASEIAREVNDKGWGESSYVTRHQLLVHPDIPYTSHNSAMCFAAEIDESCLESLIDHASAYLARESAAGSDPGLCVTVVDRLATPEALVAFGRKAKQSVVAMTEASALAAQLGIHLSAHGGSGQGIIGALAGAGLRLSGNDGRLKGHLSIATTDDTATVRDIRAHADVDDVRTLEGSPLAGDELVRLRGDKVKTVLIDGKSVLLVVPVAGTADGIAWQNCTKQQLRSY